eukprot:Blabericola_migrator_1__207@NODE_1054_length_5578_cov_25_802395_g596_i1_p3_GENE_NODE_1054_length_5578_cov_25_802395_g596_i1NODE_1054_length_5578_cov_25_802395_g596_i1_p3_ORF_typecomplete_len182_score17_63DMSP_lyase/PF16867_5/0_23_NODE_1054_length_5578_cov_25_802395_g596_i113611906
MYGFVLIFISVFAATASLDPLVARRKDSTKSEQSNDGAHLAQVYEILGESNTIKDGFLRLGMTALLSPHLPLTPSGDVGVEVLREILPGLSRFQNFHDDLIVLSDVKKLSNKQFGKALTLAKEELETEARKIVASLPPDNKLDVHKALRKISDLAIGDACLHHRSIELCSQFFGLQVEGEI